jgi:hypothetical protein
MLMSRVSPTIYDHVGALSVVGELGSSCGTIRLVYEAEVVHVHHTECYKNS